MSRVTSRSSVMRRHLTRRTYATGVTTTYVDTTTGYTTSTLNRDDIKINPVSMNGWRKPSRYSATFTSSTPGSANFIIDDSGIRAYTMQGSMLPTSPTTFFNITRTELQQLLPASSDVDRAVILARNNVADRVASFGESLAELMKSLSGLGALATQIDQFIDAALKKDYDKVARSLGIPRRSRKHRRAVIRYNNVGVPNISNAFLCWNFGLSPIIGDMVSLAILMGQGKPLRVVGKGLFPRAAGEQIVRTSKMSIPYAGLTYEVNQGETVKSGTYVRLDYEVSFEMLRNLTSYGLLDTPATAWALAPYSFLVDFVLPVSEVLRSLTATAGLSFVGGSATRFVRMGRKFLYSVPGPETKGLKWKQFQCSVDDLEGIHMVRQVFTTEPNPVTLWVKDPLSAFSVATVFSLLGQKLKLM